MISFRTFIYLSKWLTFTQLSYIYKKMKYVYVRMAQTLGYGVFIWFSCPQLVHRSSKLKSSTTQSRQSGMHPMRYVWNINNGCSNWYPVSNSLSCAYCITCTPSGISMDMLCRGFTMLTFLPLNYQLLVFVFSSPSDWAVGALPLDLSCYSWFS